MEGEGERDMERGKVRGRRRGGGGRKGRGREVWCIKAELCKAMGAGVWLAGSLVS